MNSKFPSFLLIQFKDFVVINLLQNSSLSFIFDQKFCSEFINNLGLKTFLKVNIPNDIKDVNIIKFSTGTCQMFKLSKFRIYPSCQRHCNYSVQQWLLIYLFIYLPIENTKYPRCHFKNFFSKMTGARPPLG